MTNADDLSVGKKYWEVISSSLPFEKKDHWLDYSGNPLSFSLFQEVASYVASQLPAHLERPNILEIGCGTGRIIKYLSTMLDSARIVGFDFRQN